MPFYDDNDTLDLIDEISEILVIEACDMIRERTVNVEEGDRAMLLIDITESILHKLLTVYPAIHPLDIPSDVIDRIIDCLEERKLAIPDPKWKGIVN